MNKPMNRLKKIDWKRKILLVLPLLGFMAIYMIWFSTLETTSAPRYHIIYSSLDSWIPFVPYFIFPYLSWFLFIPAMMGYLLFQDERIFQRQSLALMAGMLTFLVVSTLYPTMISLRPITMPNDGICCRMVSWLYATDTPTNVTPSIHVYNTLTVLAGFFMTDSRLSRSRKAKTVVTIISVLIVMSTLLLKQHSVLDIIAAGIMFLVVQALSMALLPLRQNGKRSTVPALKKSESRIWTK